MLGKLSESENLTWTAKSIATVFSNYVTKYNIEGSTGQFAVRYNTQEKTWTACYRKCAVDLVQQLNSYEASVKRSKIDEIRRELLKETVYVTKAKEEHISFPLSTVATSKCTKREHDGDSPPNSNSTEPLRKNCKFFHVSWKCSGCPFVENDNQAIDLGEDAFKKWSIQARGKQLRELILAPKFAREHWDNANITKETWESVLAICTTICEKIKEGYEKENSDFYEKERVIQSIAVNFGGWEKVGCNKKGKKGHAHIHVVLTREAAEAIDSHKEAVLIPEAAEAIVHKEVVLDDWEKVGRNKKSKKGHAHIHNVLPRKAAEAIDSHEDEVKPNFVLEKLIGCCKAGDTEYVTDWNTAMLVINAFDSGHICKQLQENANAIAKTNKKMQKMNNTLQKMNNTMQDMKKSNQNMEKSNQNMEKSNQNMEKILEAICAHIGMSIPVSNGGNKGVKESIASDDKGVKASIALDDKAEKKEKVTKKSTTRERVKQAPLIEQLS